jgi:hypothetical protein
MRNLQIIYTGFYRNVLATLRQEQELRVNQYLTQRWDSIPSSGVPIIPGLHHLLFPPSRVPLSGLTHHPGPNLYSYEIITMVRQSMICLHWIIRFNPGTNK